MLLQVRDPSAAGSPTTRATAFLARIHARGGCLGCEARDLARRPGPAERRAARLVGHRDRPVDGLDELPGSDAALSLPLGIRTFWAPQEVRAAARAIWSGGRLPLRVAS